MTASKMVFAASGVPSVRDLKTRPRSRISAYSVFEKSIFYWLFFFFFFFFLPGWMNEMRPLWTPSDSKSRGGFDTKVAIPFQEKETKTLIGVRFANPFPILFLPTKTLYGGGV